MQPRPQFRALLIGSSSRRSRRSAPSPRRRNAPDPHTAALRCTKLPGCPEPIASPAAASPRPHQFPQPPVQLRHLRKLFRSAGLISVSRLNRSSASANLSSAINACASPCKWPGSSGFLHGFAVCSSPWIILRLRISVAQQIVNFRRRRLPSRVRQQLHRLLRTAFVHQQLAQLFQRLDRC